MPIVAKITYKNKTEETKTFRSWLEYAAWLERNYKEYIEANASDTMRGY